jgi:CRP-like cAMP-binding protein
MGSKKNQESTVSSESIKTLKELCLMHGDDPTLHIRLADSLWKAGREVAALAVARQAYQVLKHENPAEANVIAKRFGREITVDEDHAPISETYLALADTYSGLKRRKYTLDVAKGHVLYTKGEPADTIYLVLEGELAIHAEANGVQAVVNYVHKGCLLGRDSKTDDMLYNTTAVAVKSTKLLKFSREQLQKAFYNNPDLEIQFAKDSLLRTRVELLSSMPAFSRVPMGIRFLLARRSWDVQYDKGEIVKPANEKMVHVGFVLKGVLHLYDEHAGEDAIYCGRLKEGDILGLSALMHKEVLSLKIKAETNANVLCMSFSDIEDLMDIHPAVRQKLMDTALTFSQQMTRTILLQKRLDA